MDSSPGPDMDLKNRITKPEKQAANMVWNLRPPGDFPTGPWQRGLPHMYISLQGRQLLGSFPWMLCFALCLKL